jgi:hypothetical protein
VGSIRGNSEYPTIWMTFKSRATKVCVSNGKILNFTS